MDEAPAQASNSRWRRNSLERHQAFLVLAVAGEALALASAGWKHGSTALDGLLIGLVAICGLFFTSELLQGKVSA